MWLSLFVCTTAILAMSSAEFLNDPSVVSTNIQTIYPRRHVIKGLTPTHGTDRTIDDVLNVSDKEPEKKMTKKSARNIRSVEAYGMPKAWLENNGVIEKIVPVVAEKLETLENNNTSRRVTRSIPKESENETNDLEAQDAKVFRPLFVYRQQVAKRQMLNRRRDRDYHSSYSQIYRPWVQRYPIH